MRALSYRHDVIAVLLQSQHDSELPSAGIVEFFDAESAAHTLVDTGSQRVREKLLEMEARRVEKLRASCTASQANCMQLKDDVLKPLSELMQLRVARVR